MVNSNGTSHTGLTSILIPTFNPDTNLTSLIKNLNKNWDQTRFETQPLIVIVDDGSTRPTSKEALDQLSRVNNIRVLRHEKNLGKGEALKTGLKYLENKSTDFIVTADGDGQHTPSDIFRVLEFSIEKNNFVLGVRSFKATKVPLKSLIGNFFTSTIFFLATGKKLADTQTGLRAFPAKIIEKLLNVAGQRYEYELNVLLKINTSQPIDTILIDTIYVDNNKKTFFRPIQDSLLVYGVFVRYCFVALSVSIFDFVAIYLGTIFFPTIYSFIMIRIISSHLYFFLMRNTAFRNKGILTYQLLKYYALVLMNILLSSTIFFNMYYKAKEGFFSSYFLPLLIMFFVNFLIQKKIVFK